MLMPAALGHRSGSPLFSWTQDIVVAAPQDPQQTKPKGKHSLLPVLVVLFLISYGLMALLAVEQDKTIANQRSLITSLFGDSVELSSIKGRLVQKRAQEKATEKNQIKGQGSSTNSAQDQVPSAQDVPGGAGLESRNTTKLRKEMPKRPPLGIADLVDGRRILKTI